MNTNIDNGPRHSFYGLGIAPSIIDILIKLHFTIPTPIQHKAIPIAVQGKDIVGVAQTGTGKTLAFGIPMVQQLLQKPGRGLVLLPTRELALQVEETIHKLGNTFGMRTAVLIGGASMNKQLQTLRKMPRIIIATPGRLNDHLQQGTLRLDDVTIFVLDEADRMLDMGFAPQIERVMKHLRKDRQTMLFSATIPEKIMRIATSHMKIPVSIEVAPSGTMADNITQELFIVKKDDKSKLLARLLHQYSGSVLVFSRTKHGASRIANGLRRLGFSASEIHGNKSLNQRKEALEGFKTGKYRILVATDIASRGIDVKGIELVINYDLPDDAENYVHRIGRTGRAGLEGRAISMATPEQRSEIRSIEKLICARIPMSRTPS